MIEDHIPVGEAGSASAPLNGLVEKSPLFLQEIGYKVRYRSVWVRNL